MPMYSRPLSAPSLFRTSEILTVKLAQLNLHMEPIRTGRVFIVLASISEILWNIYKMVKIFVGNLTDECTNDDLHTLFSQWENILIHTCRILTITAWVFLCEVWRDHRVRQTHRQAIWVCPHVRLPGWHHHHSSPPTLNNLEQPWTTWTTKCCQSAQLAVRKLGGLAYKGKRLKVELSISWVL